MAVGEVNGVFAEQIKGVEYDVDSLLGQELERVGGVQKGKRKLMHAIIYLAPGDYHGIHSPVDMTVKMRKHIPGKWLPMARVRSVERCVLLVW